MKLPLLTLLTLHALNLPVMSAPVAKLSNFELTDQEARTRSDRFPQKSLS